MDNEKYLVKVYLDDFPQYDPITITQNDSNSQEIVVEFYETYGVPFNLTDCTVSMVVNKSDKTTVNQALNITGDNIAGVILSTNSIASIGKNTFSLQTYGLNNDRITWGSVKFNVLKDPENGSVTSSNEYPILTQLIDDVNELNKEVSINESDRVANEVTRNSNEINRVASETERSNSEVKRITEFNDIKNEFEDLKQVAIDGNAAVNLQNQINGVNSSLDKNTQLLNDAIDGEIQAVLNNAIVQTDIENKLYAKEVEYAPRLSEAESKLLSITNEYDNEETTTLSVTFTSGYWFQNTSFASSSYYYTNKISVKKGDVITCTRNGVVQPLRFIDAYNGNSLVSSSSTETTSYTIPEGVDGLIITVYSVGIAEKLINKKSLVTIYDLKVNRKNFCFEASTTTLVANTDIVATKRIDNKKNCSYLLNGFFSSFGTLKIGHGKTEYGAVYLTIDSVNIKTYSNTGALFQTFPHGLTIQDFINVNIKVADTETARAKVTIQTNGGEFIVDNVIFFGCNGDIYANSTTQMTDVKFRYIVNDMKKDIFIFGDSYTSLADNKRFPYYLLSNGYNNMLINGFGGATSLDALTAFNNIIKVQKPKYLIWLLGMNDADTTVINANWKSTIETVTDYCEKHDIIPILATIPNTPTMKNTLKNEYVRNSGYRYVDFAKAVNAELEGATWYAGMLSTDNVHPDMNGAKALASRILLDIPELTAQ